MKLFSMHNSNNCRRVNATVQHLALDIEIVESGMGELKTPEFLANNPNGKVPTLIDGDLHLWESRAMMQYLATKKPGNTLWPSDPKKQADIARWQFWEAVHLSRGTTPFAFENLFKKIFMKQDADPAALVTAEKDFHTFAPVLNAQLESHTWITGDELTLADFSVGGCFSYAEVPAWKNTAPKL
jgi:glutathione S-transferase